MSLNRFRTLPAGGGFHDGTYQDSGTSNKYFLIKSLEAKHVLTAPKCGNTEGGNLIPHQRSTLFFWVGHKYLDLCGVCSLPVVYCEVTSIVHIQSAKADMGQVADGSKWCLTLKASRRSYLIFLGKQCHAKTCESIIGIFKDACHLDLTQFN